VYFAGQSATWGRQCSCDCNRGVGRTPHSATPKSLGINPIVRPAVSVSDCQPVAISTECCLARLSELHPLRSVSLSTRKGREGQEGVHVGVITKTSGVGQATENDALLIRQ